MYSTGVIATPLGDLRGVITTIGLTLALLVSSAMVAAAPVHAAAPQPLKAVFIVGPAGSQTAADLADAESLAVAAASYGMDVRRVFHPHATWANVMANIQGANLVYYAGHGYGWPRPYTAKLTESRQNGVGLNTFDGSGPNTHTYYGADVIRANWVLAPNALVFLNHDCYTAGNGEPGMAIPTWDVARQRVDNFAAGFLKVGARAVFAHSYQKFNKTLQLLFTTDQTVEQIFRTPGVKPLPSWGWIGWDARKFDSVRTPGARNFLDPHQTEGFLRAISGDLTMTGGDWARGVGNGEPPSISNFRVQSVGGPSFGPQATPFFTPNGDGVTDSLAVTFTVDREAFVDMTVRNGSGNVVKTFTSWSPGGPSSSAWDGKNAAGAFVPDGSYTVTAVPRNRGGTEGNTQSLDVDVFTTMRTPAVTPSLFFARDGDNLARTTTLAVNLQSAATFWWKIADANGNVVRTFVNGVNTAAGQQTVQWDGKDSSGAFVPDGTYYSVTTTMTDAGTYFHSLPVDVKAFRLTSVAAAPFVRGTKTKFFIASAETLTGKPKLRVTFPGLAPKTIYSYVQAGGGWYATVTFP
ncbi:MAG: FlgD immunoglobulin-like domain containing protein, partial [Candidatus Limnocylindrales bacterium]